MILTDLHRRMRKTDEEIKKDIEVRRLNSYVFIRTFQMIERTIDIYGDRLSDAVVARLFYFGEILAQFGDDLDHIELNFEIIDELDEWKNFRRNANNLIKIFEALANFLTEKELLPKDFLVRHNEEKSIPPVHMSESKNEHAP